MRTMIAFLFAEVEQQLDALDRKRAEIARRYIRWLALEPYLGVSVERGLLGQHGCRRIYFDAGDRPDDLFGGRRPVVRRGDEDLGKGLGWRVHWVREASRTQVRVVVVVAIARPRQAARAERLGAGHARPAIRHSWKKRRWPQ